MVRNSPAKTRQQLTQLYSLQKKFYKKVHQPLFLNSQSPILFRLSKNNYYYPYTATYIILLGVKSKHHLPFVVHSREQEHL